jgi:hypothetical protein
VYVFVLWLSIQDTRGHTPVHAVHVRKYGYAHVRKREEERRGERERGRARVRERD